MKGARIPSLTDLVFEGRNKAYGAYHLQKRYIRYLLVSFIIGTTMIGLIVVIPGIYYFLDPVPLIDGDFMYEVEYFSMSAPPDEVMDDFAHSFSKPPEETLSAPIVSDSIIPAEEKPKEKQPEELTKVENPKEDSLAMAGGSGMGSGIGEDKGLTSNIDVYPRFPGGEEARLYFLRQHIRYPEEALKKGIQGVVMIVIVVEIDGSLSRVEVVNRLGGGCDEEAIRVVKTMPRWEPGKRQGKAVRVVVRFPILFRIPGRS